MSKLTLKKSALAVSKQAMADRLAAMRKENGIETCEKRTLHMLCSATGRPFAVTFTRHNQGERFKIERIDSAGSRATGLADKLFAQPEIMMQSFSAKEFDLAEFACPHCGHKGQGAVADFFECQCKQLQCGARIRVVANVTHAACHDGCGRTGILGRRLDSFSGDEGHAKEHHKTLGGQNAKFLPGQSGKALPSLKKK